MSLRRSSNTRGKGRRLAMAIACSAVMAAGCTVQTGPMPAPTFPGNPIILTPPTPLSPPPVTRTFIYPDRGQSPQQEEFDKGQCYSWAVQQTGFDPANPPVATAPPPSPGAPQGGMFRGALGGAALGSIGGAIGGNAGEGAAIGAGVGALFGAVRRARWMEEQQQQQASYAAQQQSILSQGHARYNLAFATCMRGRGYTVS